MHQKSKTTMLHGVTVTGLRLNPFRTRVAQVQQSLWTLPERATDHATWLEARGVMRTSRAAPAGSALHHRLTRHQSFVTVVTLMSAVRALCMASVVKYDVTPTEGTKMEITMRFLTKFCVYKV